MIGNDIVDLNLAKKESNWQRKGFLEKQFTLNEQRTILKSENPFLQVWLFWSMKEAAYKCYTQKHLKRFFAPQKFECSLTSKDEGVVFFNDNKYYTTTFIDAFYIYTIANSKLKRAKVFSSIGSPKTIDKDLKQTLVDETGISLEEIEQRKSPIGAPLYYHEEKKLTSSCTITHHGNYGAFAFMIQNET